MALKLGKRSINVFGGVSMANLRRKSKFIGQGQGSDFFDLTSSCMQLEQNNFLLLKQRFPFVGDLVYFLLRVCDFFRNF